MSFYGHEKATTPSKYLSIAMSVHVRDTVLGQLVRLCSGKQLLQFPDEKDPGLWKQSITHPTPAIAVSDHSDSAQESNDETQTNQNNQEQARGEKENDLDSFPPKPTQRSSPEKAEISPDNGKILVDWYGNTDPEVQPHKDRQD